MSEESRDPRRGESTLAFGTTALARSVLNLIAKKVGAAPRISLREEDSAGAPPIDARSQEKLALPQGRGTYQILGEIARGGMGVVLKGHDTDLGRDVAMKVLNRDFTERPEVIQRFVEEAQIGGQLQHPGIVPVYELGLMADERPYFTMKLVKGRTLATLLAERDSVTDDRRRLIDVFEAVCQTMAYAHSRGVIHRDLKPANVMVGAFGEVQVVDWGLAKVLARGGTADEKKAREAQTVHTVLETVRSPGSGSGSGSDSVIGSVMGTPGYMSPEQAGGHVDRLDERSDVFSLGAILCEILTGRPPYTGEGEKTLVQAAQAELEPALARLGSCAADPALVKLTKQCLLAAPAARPRHAGVVAERIHGHVVSLEERARRAQIEAAEARVRADEARGRELQERKARKLTLALAASVLGMGVVGGGGWLLVQGERAVRAREEAARQRDLVAGVGAALNEAAVLQGQERWSDALAAVDRAQTLAGAGEPGAELRARIAAVRDEVRSATDAAAEREARRRRVHALVAALDEIESGGRDTEGGFGTSLINWPAIDRAHREVFASHGIDVDGASVEEVADALARLGVTAELVPALHWWMAARRESSRRAASEHESEEDLGPALRLVEIAHRIDDDPLRADLREAMLADDVDMLGVLARGDTAGQPPATLGLLAAALSLNGEYDEALGVLRRALHHHPDDYYLRVSLLRTLYQRESRGPRVAEEFTRHAQAATAMRPDNLTLRADALWGLFGRATFEENRDDRKAARLSYRELLEETELLRSRGAPIGVGDEDRVGLALWRLGEEERAVEHYRRAAARHPDARVLHHALGVLLDALGRHADAEAALARAVASDPASALSYSELCVVRAKRLARSGDGAAAADRLEADVAGHPHGPLNAFNEFAWRFATVPRARLLGAWTPGSAREAAAVDRALATLTDKALEMAERAAERSFSATRWNTLAAMRFRVGDPAGCIEAMTRSMELSSGGNAFDWIFVAMARHALGDEALARDWLRRADRWLRERRAGSYLSNYKALALRAEARERLGAD